jgi:hypothetical protein
MVAYTLWRSEDGERFELHRWSTSELPDSLDREFPPSDDPASLLVADDLSYFALRFLDDAGEWRDRWGSTQLVDSSELPIAVEIEVALAAPEGSQAGSDAEQLDAEPIHYARAVELPLRPIDLETLLDPEGGKETEVAENEGSGRTLADCIDVSKLSLSGSGLSQTDLASLQAAIENTPAADIGPYASVLASLAPSGAVHAGCL